MDAWKRSDESVKHLSFVHSTVSVSIFSGMTQEQAMRMQEIKLLLEQAAASEGQQKMLFRFNLTGEEGKGGNASRLHLSSFPSLEDR